MVRRKLEPVRSLDTSEVRASFKADFVNPIVFKKAIYDRMRGANTRPKSNRAKALQQRASGNSGSSVEDASGASTPPGMDASLSPPAYEETELNVATRSKRNRKPKTFAPPNTATVAVS